MDIGWVCHYQLAIKQELRLFIELISNILAAFSAATLAGILAVSVLLFYVFESSRWVLIPLLLQYVLIGMLLGKAVYVLLAPAWVIVGLCVAGLFAVSGTAMPQNASSTEIDSQNRSMGLFFDGFTLLLAAMISYGVWTLMPIDGIPAAANLAFYWLIVVGLVLLLQRRRSLYALGAISFLNGAFGLYLHIETSLLVVALASLIMILAGYVAATLSLQSPGVDE